MIRIDLLYKGDLIKEYPVQPRQALILTGPFELNVAMLVIEIFGESLILISNIEPNDESAFHIA